MPRRRAYLAGGGGGRDTKSLPPRLRMPQYFRGWGCRNTSAAGDAAVLPVDDAAIHPSGKPQYFRLTIPQNFPLVMPQYSRSWGCCKYFRG